MFRVMYHLMHYHRTYFHNLTTCLWEEGRRDPHRYVQASPFNMPVDRIAYYANGNDVGTVIVDGKISM